MKEASGVALAPRVKKASGVASAPRVLASRGADATPLALGRQADCGGICRPVRLVSLHQCDERCPGVCETPDEAVLLLGSSGCHRAETGTPGSKPAASITKHGCGT